MLTGTHVLLQPTRVSNAGKCHIRCYANANKIDLRKRANDFGSLCWMHMYCSPSGLAVERIKCQLIYFYSVDGVQACQISKITVTPQLKDNIVFHRKFVPKQLLPSFDTCELPLCTVNFSSKTRIEESQAAMHIDFANKFLHMYAF